MNKSHCCPFDRNEAANAPFYVSTNFHLFSMPIDLNASSFQEYNVNVGCGRGGGRVVSVLVLYSDDLSSNPTEANNFSVNLLLNRMKINKKRSGLDHFLYNSVKYG